MRAGLRLRILLLLGGLLLVAFVPLYAAVATYTTLAVHRLRAEHARALGDAVARTLAGPDAGRTVAELSAERERALSGSGVLAVGAYDVDGRQIAARGPEARRGLPAQLDAEATAVREVALGSERALLVAVPVERGTIAVLARVEEATPQVTSLLRLLALYTGIVALALLVLAHFALTRLIVRPLDALARAAERVAGGARRLVVPETRVRELAELGHSLHTMTEALIANEAALRRKIDEAEAAAARLKEAQQRLVSSERLASVGRLAAGLAHEIGNPISALMAMQDLLLTSELSADEQRDFLERMRRETDRIHRIIRDLLQFARPSAQRGTSERTEPGDVAAAVSDTIALVSPQKALEKVELSLDVEQDLPRVGLSREQLVQVTLNLVLNAADAVAEVAAGGRVTVTARARGEKVELVVEDDGPGVAPEIRPVLFEPFATTKEVGRGTGLGLAVCRGLVESVGGTIALDETYTDGARFVVTLPAVPPERRSVA
ncbi:MAG: HAMP domain-containing sensor histidine kinase [Pseudomonadota bacterium]